MFGIVRMIFWLLISVVLIEIMKKYNLLQKKKNIIFIGIMIISLWTLSMLFPVENIFITFDTPEDSYNYVNNEKVKKVVYGEETALVIGEENEYVYLIVPKGENGWKVGRGMDFKFVSEQYIDGIIVSVYQYKDTKEFYVEVVDIDGNQCVIKDNQTSDFKVLEQNYNGKNTYRYYAYIENLDDSYKIEVNGKKFLGEN